MKRRDDPNQILIDWSNPPGEVVTTGSEEAAAKLPQASSVATSPSSPVCAPPETPLLVQRLRWDFKTTFPQPTDEAIDAGTISDEDNVPFAIEAIHDEHARELFSILHDLDAVMDARRRGVDPQTGKPPRTHATQEKLRRFFQEEPPRLERSYANLLAVYQDAFGADAADAFDKAIRARYANIEVIGAQPTEAHGADIAIPISKRKPSRLSSVMPVPKPLPHAVRAGHFGHGEDGKPVTPDPDEVRAITERHAERIMELLDRLDATDRSIELPCTDKGRLYAERDRMNALILTAVKVYAEDFGEPAAKQLERYTRVKKDGRGK